MPTRPLVNPAFFSCFVLPLPRELNAVAGRKLLRAGGRRKRVIGPELAAPLVNDAGILVERVNLGIGEGEHEAALVGRFREVGGVGLRHIAQGVVLLRRPVNPARLVEGFERLRKLALVHLAEGRFLLGLLDALHVAKDRRAVRLPQRLEHAAALDAGKLRVVAGENKFRAGIAGGGGKLRKIVGRNHRRLVDDEDGVVVPLAAPVFEGHEFGGNRVGAREAVAAHLLHDIVCPRKPDDFAALGLIGRAHGVQGIALAGSRLAPQHRKTFRAGEVGQGLGLFRFERMGGGRRRNPPVA